MLNPALWGNLPEELLNLVFLRLPLPDIGHLRCLSKHWHWKLTSEDSEFRRALADVYSKLFAFISHYRDDENRFEVVVYDIVSSTWYAFRISFGEFDVALEPVTSDKGLVVFVCTSIQKRESLRIVVCDPVTRRVETLPPPTMTIKQLTMVHLDTDPEKKCYKLLIVGYRKDDSETLVVELFDSSTFTWTNTNLPSNLVYGYVYSFTENNYLGDVYEAHQVDVAMYDNVERQLLNFSDDSNSVNAGNLEDSALVGHTLFTLHRVMRPVQLSGEVGKEYCISEFRGQKHRPNWIKVKEHNCSGLFNPPVSLEISACKGKLVVMAWTYWPNGGFKHKIVWLYDLSSGVWRALPAFPPNVQVLCDALMCEIQLGMWL